MSNALDDLIAKVEMGTFRWNAWAEPALERTLMAKVEDAYYGDLNAAKKLHDELLPGPLWLTFTGLGATIGVKGEEYTGKSPDPARSWLIAILKAMKEGKDA